jgi:hypothetical protein
MLLIFLLVAFLPFWLAFSVWCIEIASAASQSKTQNRYSFLFGLYSLALFYSSSLFVFFPILTQPDQFLRFAGPA